MDCRPPLTPYPSTTTTHYPRSITTHCPYPSTSTSTHAHYYPRALPRIAIHYHELPRITTYYQKPKHHPIKSDPQQATGLSFWAEEGGFISHSQHPPHPSYWISLPLPLPRTPHTQQPAHCLACWAVSWHSPCAWYLRLPVARLPR
jgi:hypothetical protein